MRGLSIDSRYRVVRNLFQCPNATAYNAPSGFAINNGRWFGPSGAGTYSLVTSATDGPVGLTTYARKSWTTAPTGGSGDSGFQLVANERASVIPGSTVYLSAWVRLSISRQIYWRIAQYNVATGGTALRDVALLEATPTANTWTDYAVSYTIPADTTYANLYLDSGNVSPAWAVGDTFDITGIRVSYDGQFPALSGDSPNWQWDGTPDASTSRGLVFVP